MKNAVFWGVTPSGSSKNRRFGGTYRFLHQGDKNQRGTTLAVVLRLLVTANFDPSSSILVALMMKALYSYETSVLTGATSHHIPEDGILHSHRRENLKSYIALTGWTL
jgi:hypothetical protein